MRSQHLAPIAAVLFALAPLAQAQTAAPSTPLSPKAQYAADSKAAKARYDQDLKLCASEPTAEGRMQCKRDAKAAYDQALAEAKARTGVSAPAKSSAAAQPACADCGKVIAVRQVQKEGEGSAVGLVAGGVAGALLGNQVGSGTGRKLATVAGAAGGAYAGREIEKKVKTHTVWAVTVEFPHSGSAVYEFESDPGFRVGETVRRTENNSIARP
ncbi:glycine zipper 2TM domain-containing protein [Extensimonas vulgaris]|jgi:outer membrane lipoprotein SlyB|uniref:Glycine zipper 2TM protein n=1 Tax=Extensimonas vulgaris TaxID=1031594 RepID=A0A369AP87_9BURK|nr:glycine zipper 2TM domain-containing protein [Extensimonas vulgaris]RCX10148.1 glycine zipper 2TM protein [Extensimonas vulgaris]TWI39729.1 glycine zipper 2TM protein [Extensimonas vulgaris]TXD17296.1 glycine zipper 2TM domain-containing protein [Extensimonas vulgaris]